MSNDENDYILLAEYINEQGHRIVIERNGASKNQNITVLVNGFPFRIEKERGIYVYWRCMKKTKYKYVPICIPCLDF